MSKKFLFIIGLAVSLFALSACGDSDDGESGDAAAEEGAAQEGVPEPDLGGVPDVVAVVNGDEIPKEEFITTYESQLQQRAAQAQASGEEVNQDELKKQTAESMVDSELLTQEAEGRGFTASEKDINKTLKDLAEQNGLGSVDEFMKALKEQGMEEKEVKSQLETQVIVDQLVADETGDIKPSKKELQKLYDQAKAQQKETGEGGGELPSFDEMKPQLEEQAKAEKESQVIQTLVGDLRKDADVTVNLS